MKSILKISLDDIQYTWKLINMRIDENKVFFDLKNLLNQNLKKR